MTIREQAFQNFLARKKIGIGRDLNEEEYRSALEEFQFLPQDMIQTLSGTNTDTTPDVIVTSGVVQAITQYRAPLTTTELVKCILCFLALGAIYGWSNYVDQAWLGVIIGPVFGIAMSVLLLWISGRGPFSKKF